MTAVVTVALALPRRQEALLPPGPSDHDGTDHPRATLVGVSGLWSRRRGAGPLSLLTPSAIANGANRSHRRRACSRSVSARARAAGSELAAASFAAPWGRAALGAVSAASTSSAGGAPSLFGPQLKSAAQKAKKGLYQRGSIRHRALWASGKCPANTGYSPHASDSLLRSSAAGSNPARGIGSCRAEVV